MPFYSIQTHLTSLSLAIADKPDAMPDKPVSRRVSGIYKATKCAVVGPVCVVGTIVKTWHRNVENTVSTVSKRVVLYAAAAAAESEAAAATAADDLSLLSLEDKRSIKTSKPSHNLHRSGSRMRPIIMYEDDDLTLLSPQLAAARAAASAGIATNAGVRPSASHLSASGLSPTRGSPILTPTPPPP
jgi:hypothetical protein